MAGASDWITTISQLVFMTIFLLMFFGANQRIQVYIWSRNIKMRLALLERLAREAYSKAETYLRDAGAKEPRRVLDRLIDFFVIEPVSIEPVDIIKRLEHLLITRELRFKDIISAEIRNASSVEKSIAAVIVEIALVLNAVYKIVRHLLLLGERNRNWILIMQLELLMPQIVRQAEAYRKAMDAFIDGKPVGDGLGPLVAYRLVGAGPRRRVAHETVVAEASIDGRRLLVIKAEGPNATVGKPGEAVEKVVKELNGRVSLIITVDAALKLEGESTGTVAEGVGAAIGDPGPEKIKIERVASRYGIPLRAIVVKMGMEEAIMDMKKEICEAADRVVEKIREIVSQETKPGDAIIVAGIGNTVGIY